MLLQGNLKEFSLPNVFQLVKMSAKTGALSITKADESGKIFFRNGQIYFATAHPGTMPNPTGRWVFAFLITWRLLRGTP